MKGRNHSRSYINELQSNKNRLDTINQTIRKYNQSVLYCREDNEDMAIIQLKKVISQNSKFVKAYQLLALLYMKRQEYERARKLLKKAANIDTTNTTTLRYLQEIEDATGKSTRVGKKHWRFEKEKEEAVSGTLRYMSGTEMVIHRRRSGTARRLRRLSISFSAFCWEVRSSGSWSFRRTGRRSTMRQTVR